MSQTIIVSAVNLVEGGGLSVLIDCLSSMSVYASKYDYNIIALVNNKEIVKKLPRVEYLEVPKAKKSYIFRFYYEYIYFYHISRRYNPRLWLSMHDMTPVVKADIQAVYMHNPTPFYRPNKLAWKISPITAVWSYLYKYIYRINIHSNNYLIVQQNWLRGEFSRMFSVPKSNIIVARPVFDCKEGGVEKIILEKNRFIFLYPSYPRVFKNFEVICEAAKFLEKEGVTGFTIKLTIDGSENKYSRYLVETYGSLNSIDFIGLQPKSEMDKLYADSDCMLFPSKLETWGLPLSEYQRFRKPMLVADLPYAHESSEGGEFIRFFKPDDEKDLAMEMKKVINGDLTDFKQIEKTEISEPYAKSWDDLFEILLGNK